MVAAPLRACRSYLLGAMHDGTIHGSTVRISQKEETYVKMVRDLISGAGGRAWTYREGRLRSLYVVEFSHSFLASQRLVSRQDFINYARGFFDAEGSVPRDAKRAPYLYFAQKDRMELASLRGILERLGIHCGTMHRPSARADPEYWRFYVHRASHLRFASLVGSYHPRKAPLLQALATWALTEVPRASIASV